MKICDWRTIDYWSSICSRKTRRRFCLTFLDERCFDLCCSFQKVVKLKTGIKVKVKRSRSFVAGESEAVLCFLGHLQYAKHIIGKEIEESQTEERRRDQSKTNQQ